MKKLALTLCIAGSALALNACNSVGQGEVNTAAPYEMERTARHETTVYEPVREPVRVERKVERRFREVQSK